KTGANVEWSRNAEIKEVILFQYQQFDTLVGHIDRTGKETTSELEIRGTLVGADITSRRFHFVTETDDDIRGRFLDAISDSQHAELPAKYTARVTKTTKIIYSTEQEEVSYFLNQLAPFPIA
ncbi:MAG TPA: hypothetical protein VJ521_13155, partial [Acidobacteriota bacterium]|nr:hypothetical protein [Acidobacteriota bacterium]